MRRSKVGDDGEGKEVGRLGEEDQDWRNFQNAKTDHELLPRDKQTTTD